MSAAAASSSTAWSRPALLAQVVRVRRDGHHEAALHLANLHTPHQVLRVQNQLQALVGLDGVHLDRTAQRVRAHWDPAHVDLPMLLDACAAADCPALPLAVNVLDNPRRREAHAALRRLIVAGLFAMQAMMFASVLYIAHFDDVPALTRDLFRWLGLLAATPVVIWAAMPFYSGAIEDWRQRRLGTETVVALAAAFIYVASLVAAVRGRGDIYFDSISMLVFVLLAGRYLEMRARHRAGALGENASDAAPAIAQRRRADGTLEPVAATELVAGDEVHVAEGGVLPADGTLINARVRVDESLLSGESRPQVRTHGESVLAGAVVVSGPLDMRVTRASARSTLASLGTLATRASEQQRKAARDPLAARFSARVLLVTAGTAILWLLIDPSRAFDAAVAVLVVACPCAFALAAPVVSSRALAVLGRHGVWVTRPDALAALARADHALLDKTGTLTVPRVAVETIRPLRNHDVTHVLQLAAALARESRHPLARALTAAAGDISLPQAEDIEVIEGAGIRGRVAGAHLRLGRTGFGFDPGALDTDEESLLLSDAQGPLAVFPVNEHLRSDAARCVNALRASGVQLEIVSGDSAGHVAATARKLDIAQWHARQSPANKLQHLRRRHAAGAVILAVGDGSNDAPLLAAADVSGALLGGTDLAQAHADLLLADGLDGLPLARQIAQRAQTILTQNQRGAMIYNLCAVPFAAAGLVPPWLAVIGMSLSSLGVVLNAWRIREPRAASDAQRQHLRERSA